MYNGAISIGSPTPPLSFSPPPPPPPHSFLSLPLSPYGMRVFLCVWQADLQVLLHFHLEAVLAGLDSPRRSGRRPQEREPMVGQVTPTKTIGTDLEVEVRII